MRDNSLKIYAVKLKPIEKQLFDHMLSYISVDEQERIRRFIKFEDALRGLTSKILLRFIIVSLLGKKNDSICFEQNEYGKPFLAGVKDFHFNLSHSGDWVVCAVDNLPIGIDVEKIREIDLNLSKRFFSQQEHNYLSAMDKDRRIESFYELWTLKESYIKADGRGLSIPLNSFSFTIEDGNIEFKAADNFEQYYFKQYEIDPSYKLSVCSKNTNFPDKITQLSFDELVRLAKEYL